MSEMLFLWKYAQLARWLLSSPISDGCLAYPTLVGSLTCPSSNGFLARPTPNGCLAHLISDGHLACPSPDGFLVCPTLNGCLVRPALEGHLACPSLDGCSNSPESRWSLNRPNSGWLLARLWLLGMHVSKLLLSLNDSTIGLSKVIIEVNHHTTPVSIE